LGINSSDWHSVDEEEVGSFISGMKNLFAVYHCKVLLRQIVANPPKVMSILGPLEVQTLSDIMDCIKSLYPYSYPTLSQFVLSKSPTKEVRNINSKLIRK
ncbi:MAG: hypothetical protein VX901_05530, partial [Candidatus Poribacteria bacterium]|nr:hypothetical protein [Candidatus Poribacteria bacterium]